MYQRVYKYLKLFDSKKFQELENFQYIGTLEDTDKQCLETIIKHCGTPNPTWKEIRHFVWFLNNQLSACEQSNVIRTVKGLKEFTVKFMIDMSRDFATSSMPTGEGNEDIIKQHNPRQNWEHNLHPYLFFNKSRKSVTHVGLALNGSEVVNEKSHYQCKFSMKISPEVERFLSVKVNVPQIFQQKIGNVSERSSNEGYMLLKRLVNFMNIPIEDGMEIISPDENYVLTQDNLTKIMGIQTRFRCQIPVVLMGETGCGKTHLIRFMCKVAAYRKNIKNNMFIMKIHGGTTEEDVIKCLEKAEFEALKTNRTKKVDTVVFFDEANTSDVISLIKEIMCDGKCRGKPVPPFLKFVAACNPYRCHSEAMIKQLKGAGLGWKDKEPSKATEKLGEIPLRDLVYRVLQIPDSLKALVYDFGKLDSNTERDYIYQIVYSRLRKEINGREIPAIATVLAECQKYLKENEDECSFVSLRDVERAMIFFKFFHNEFIVLFPVQKNESRITESLLLALTVSYFARLDSQDVDGTNARTKFEDHICKVISRSNELKRFSAYDFRLMLSQYQNKLLDCMSIEENIARNAALKENLFMMFVCIQLRIPLFLVGKPGSSKSLAKTIIQISMRGQNSKNEKLKQFNHVHLHSYQCSELSTADSIRDVFDAAVKYQKKRREKDRSFVSVVVLDEVGLAEASPFLPLKSLHPLLEDGTEGTGSTDERVNREDRVAFIGISNWALDPAKMNRGILVRRSEPTIKDLTDSAKFV
ncbi:PREDICTED: E3 ubiquitin-protein ligase rnf213-beta-like [Amphimedon queenslandica]|uniref:AAA+ ATPase domain-containing protein n=1 Tax=Amphimedon queenslandica TaxID=400682 RepID=A0AAN0JLE1_AMPQE|nr:PREDICTED: E3 ubiquitin-protein ligase rnf213-beta-like [Amphimedon queenslandica]|eukprot:XP_019857803.1 PREDICTED: E3 ubiquitin-protein ligase rnf213-beta-like [Amphimedon queenslandica]